VTPPSTDTNDPLQGSPAGPLFVVLFLVAAAIVLTSTSPSRKRVRL
jgi:hypothetical protein